MEGFQRLVAMAIRDDNSEKANRLIEKVHVTVLASRRFCCSIAALWHT
ncbi:hypothetical protein M513_06331 [Trichuris suis]|uniref:Uncharacterized protein n=1 Tax=Trichuris suis TaxID=68888 RepID=A0A085M6J4_9BILA|nr:hypothetical protein M513_06331 [Trichuris suis]